MMAVVMTNLENKGKAAQAKPAAAPAKPAAAPAKPVEEKKEAPASTGLKSENIFGMMATYLN
jgi:hypothetical protein